MKHYPRRIFLPLAAVTGMALLSSCDPFRSPKITKIFDPVPNYRIVEPEAVVPKNFLYNPDQVYNEWMDTPLRVNYHEVSVDTIFSDVPFDGFRYQLFDIPSDMEPVTIDALGQTRRQLLWAIAHDNNLKMILLTTDGGRPSCVAIRWRGDRSTNERGTIDR